MPRKPNSAEIQTAECLVRGDADGGEIANAFGKLVLKLHAKGVIDVSDAEDLYAKFATECEKQFGDFL